MTDSTPLSVWPVTQQTARSQRSGRYDSGSAAHPGKMLPELARTAIRRYSGPGDLVLDPMCGIGTTLVESTRLDRRAVGVELEPRWAALAARNVGLAARQGARGRSLVVADDARRLGRGLLDQLGGEVALVLTSPPYGPSVHGRVRCHPDHVEKFDDRYSDGRENLANLPAGERGSPLLEALADVLGGCRRLLAAEGRLVLTARPFRRNGALIDLPGQLTALAREVGLELEARHAALLCGLREGGLVSRASFFQLQQQRSGAASRTLVIAHEDVLVFRHGNSAHGTAAGVADRSRAH